MFDELNKCKVQYAVLRGYEDLPSKIKHDIDFCIRRNDLESGLCIVHRVLKSYSFVCIHSSNRYGFSQRYYYRDGECIKLDFWTDFSYKGLRYLELGQVLEQTKIHNKIVVLNESAEVTLSFLKEFLHNAHIRIDKISLLQEKYKKNGFLDGGSFSFLSSHEIKKFELYLLQEKLDLKHESDKYKKKILSENIRKIGVFGTVSNIMSYIVKYIKDFLTRKGFFVVFIGPDGSGKTTAAKNILNLVDNKKSCFEKSRYLHGRPGILPNLSYIAMRKERQNTKTMDLNVYSASRHDNYSKWKTFIYMSYYYFDFLLGAVSIFLSKFANRIVVADRYFYDYFISEHFSNHSKILRQVYFRLLPEPDLVIFMDGDPDSIYDRKPEIPVESIKRQQKNIKKIAGRINNFKTIDTSESVTTSNIEISNEISRVRPSSVC